MSETNKQKIVRWTEMINGRDATDIGEVFAQDCVITNGGAGMEELHGPEALAGLLAVFWAGFSDLQITMDDLIEAEDDHIVVPYTARGTHDGELMGIPPTGNRIEMAGIGIYRFENGKVVHEWVMDDLFGLMQQLDVVPAGH